MQEFHRMLAEPVVPELVNDDRGRPMVRYRGAYWPVPAGGNGSGDNSGDDDSDDDADDQDDGSGNDDQDGDGSGGDDDGDQGDEAKFTQADLDAKITERLERERRKHEKKLNREVEKAKADAAKAGDDAGKAADDGASDERVAKLNKRAVTAEAKAVALGSGVKPDRMNRFLRLVDLDDVDVDDDGEVDEDAVADAVKAALEDVPEFAGSGESKDEPKRTKSGGDNHKGDDTGPLLTREQIKAMSPEEINENWEQIQKSLAAQGKAK